MTQEWDVSVWGVRGSFPKPELENQIFGGNTACISASCGETAIVLDAGSGITGYAKTFRREEAGNRLNVLISHLHIDHVMGLFYFYPLFDPELEIHFYGCEGLKEYLAALVRTPYWPVGLFDFSARLNFHEFAPGQSFQIGDVRVDTMAGSHPGGSILYRLSSGGKRLVHALDCEMTEDVRPELTEFVRDCDLLVWDADFTSDDLIAGWGHSTWEQGIAMRGACGAKRVLMTHYNWNYTDEYLLQLEKTAKEQDDACLFAREGMVLKL